MIIFGWGFVTKKVFKISFPVTCSHCHNEGFWTPLRTITWFTLFFIPIIPYSIKYFLTCPICEYGIRLKSDQIKEVKLLVKENEQLPSGKDLNNSEPMQVDNVLPEVLDNKEKEKPPGEPNKNNFCSFCGINVSVESKYCGSCGYKLV